MSKPIFETPRLILREWEDTDVTPFAALFADPFVIEHIPPPDRLNVEAITTSIREQILPGQMVWGGGQSKNAMAHHLSGSLACPSCAWMCLLCLRLMLAGVWLAINGAKATHPKRQKP